MATVNLHPSSTVSNEWVISGGDGTVHGVLSDDVDSSVIKNPHQNQTAIVQLDDFSIPYDSITSIRFYVRGVLFNARSGDTDIQVKLENSSGTSLYAETVTLNFTAAYAPEDHYGTLRTTSDGSAAWTGSDLNGLRRNINTSPEDPPVLSFAQVTKVYVEVTYVPFHISKIKGSLTLKGGSMIIK